MVEKSRFKGGGLNFTPFDGWGGLILQNDK